MNPCRRFPFYVSHDLGQLVCRLQTDQQVNMIYHSSNRLGNHLQSFGRPSHICMQSGPPCFNNKRALMLGAKDNVVVEAEMG